MGARPAYLSRSSLAAELQIGESTLDEMVRRGVVPPPVRLSSGCVRWRWESVDQALAARLPSGEVVVMDEASAGVQRALEAAKAGRRGRAA